MPATAASPYALVARVTKACPTGVATWVRIAGNAIAQIGPMSATTCAGVGRSNPPYFRRIGCSAIPAITTRATTLAIAAPVRSQPKPKIRIGSSTAVATAPQTVAIIAEPGIAVAAQDRPADHAHHQQVAVTG